MDMTVIIFILTIHEPSPVANAVREYLAVNASVRYQCVDGYQRTAGSLVRACNNSTLSCKDPAPVCTCSIPMKDVKQNPESDAKLWTKSVPAVLAIDQDNRTCSRTGVSPNPTWRGAFDSARFYLQHVTSVKLVLKLDLDVTYLNSSRYCGGLNPATVAPTDLPDIVIGTIHCAPGSQTPKGKGIVLTARFGGGGHNGSLQICDLQVWKAPHDDFCSFPPRIPRLKMVTNQTSFARMDTVHYECEHPYTPLYGSGEATCGIVSRWSTPSLKCTDKLFVDAKYHTLLSSVGGVFHLPSDWEVTGVRMDPAPRSHVNITVYTAEEQQKRCTDTVYNATSLYVACSQRPSGRKIMVTNLLSKSVPSHNPTLRVFGKYASIFTLECLQSDNGAEYRGKMANSSKGLPCKSWANQFFSHPYKDWHFPDSSMAKAGNYCRNPAGSRPQPWCYVDSSLRWDFCPLYRCERICRLQPSGADYKGFEQHTGLGNKCKKWNSIDLPFVRPLDFPDVSTDHNFCRNPGQSQSKPWCFVGGKVTKNKNVEGELTFGEKKLKYDHCDIPLCPTYVYHFVWNAKKLNVDTTAARECHTRNALLRTPSWKVLADKACEGTDTVAHALCYHLEYRRGWISITFLCHDLMTQAADMISSSVELTTPTTDLTSSSGERMSTSTTHLTSSLSMLTEVSSPASSLGRTEDSAKANSTHSTPQHRDITSTTTTTAETTEKTPPTSTQARSSSFNSSPARANKCHCRVGPRSRTLDRSAAQEKAKATYHELTVDPRNLSRTIRKKSSARDDRVSATTMGTVGIAVLCVTFLLLAVPDLLELWRRTRPPVVPKGAAGNHAEGR
ncbi:hypothetical protein ACOMHN_040774 [Nucella lapillus]